MQTSQGREAAPENQRVGRFARHWFWWLLLVVTAWKVVAASLLDLCTDEGYYYAWSIMPQLSYLDHPGMTGWALWLSRLVFGPSVWTVRIWPVAGGTVFTLIGRALARRMFDARTGDRAGALLLLAPIFAGNGLLMTPDTLCAVFWAAALFLTWRAAEPGARFWWWVPAGACAGCGLLSKYSTILYFLGLALFWFVSPGRRRRLFLGGLTVGVAALVVFTPAIVWNAQHEWVSFRYQLKHGLSEHAPSVGRNLTQLAAGLTLAATPIVGVLCFWSAARGMWVRDARRRFLAAFFWAIVLFFVHSSLKAKVQFHWTMLAFVTGCILVAADWPHYRRLFRWSALVVLLGIDLAAAGYLLVPANVPLAWHGRSFDPGRMREFFGAKDVCETVRDKFAETKADFICVSTYGWYGKLCFYEPDLADRVWQPSRGRTRFPWVNDGKWKGKTALLVATNTANWRGAYFREIVDLGVVEVPFKRYRFHRLHFYLGRGYEPEKVPPALWNVDARTQ